MSNETPKPSHAKTKLVPKYLRYVFVAIAIIAVILPFFFIGRPTTTLVSGDKKFQLEIVSTAESQQKGLGGRSNMADDHGMIFVFDPPATQCFWMKDMQFALDIIWLNAEKKVTKVAQNISPESYPEKFCSDDATKYVIELNAGQAAKAGIVPGKVLSL